MATRWLDRCREGTRALVERARAATRRVKREVAVWRLVLRDSRTPLIAKGLLLFGVTYALIPFDLIPDFIPVLGFVDDLVLVAVPIIIAAKLVPPEVLADARSRA